MTRKGAALIPGAAPFFVSGMSRLLVSADKVNIMTEKGAGTGGSGRRDGRCGRAMRHP